MSSTETVTPTAVVRSIFERLNDRDAESLINEFGADGIVEDWPIVGRLEGRQAVKDRFSALFAAMPDAHIELDRMAADGETVFVRWHLNGHLLWSSVPRHRSDRPLDRHPRERLRHDSCRKGRGELPCLRRDDLRGTSRSLASAREPSGPDHDRRDKPHDPSA